MGDHVSGAEQYLRQRVSTASPAELVAMLLDAAVARAAAGADDIEAGAYRQAAGQINRSQRIIVELRATLDHERGGEIAGNLDRIYEFAHRRLMDACRDWNAKAARDAVVALTPIRDGWREAMLSGAAQPTAVGAP
jgi:flagellar protein FliS